MSKLQFITQETFTADKMSITNCFSADYENYILQQTNYTPLSSTSQSVIRLINASGTVISASDYHLASLFMPAYSSFVEDRYTTRTFLFDGLSNDLNTHLGGGATYTIFNPFGSGYTFGMSQNSSFNDGSGVFGRKNIGVLKQSVSITGFQILSTGSTLISSNIKVFGIK
jgi:hypothetical protein